MHERVYALLKLQICKKFSSKTNPFLTFFDFVDIWKNIADILDNDFTTFLSLLSIIKVCFDRISSPLKKHRGTNLKTPRDKFKNTEGQI